MRQLTQGTLDTGRLPGGNERVNAGHHDGGFDEQAALEEIELYAEIVIAAEASDRPLTMGEIDAVLGVRRGQRANRPSRHDSINAS